MSLRILHVAVIDQITKAIRAFWWNGNLGQNKGFKLLSWDTIATPKDLGCTGICHFEIS